MWVCVCVSVRVCASSHLRLRWLGTRPWRGVGWTSAGTGRPHTCTCSAFFSYSHFACFSWFWTEKHPRNKHGNPLSYSTINTDVTIKKRVRNVYRCMHRNQLPPDRGEVQCGLGPQCKALVCDCVYVRHTQDDPPPTAPLAGLHLARVLLGAAAWPQGWTQLTESAPKQPQTVPTNVLLIRWLNYSCKNNVDISLKIAACQIPLASLGEQPLLPNYSGSTNRHLPPSPSLIPPSFRISSSLFSFQEFFLFPSHFCWISHRTNLDM